MSTCPSSALLGTDAMDMQLIFKPVPPSFPPSMISGVRTICRDDGFGEMTAEDRRALWLSAEAMDAVTNALSTSDGRAITDICALTGLGQTTVRTAVYALVHDGIARFEEQRVSIHNKRRLYWLVEV